MKQSSSATVGIILSDELWGCDDQNKALSEREKKIHQWKSVARIQVPLLNHNPHGHTGHSP